MFSIISFHKISGHGLPISFKYIVSNVQFNIQNNYLLLHGIRLAHTRAPIVLYILRCFLSTFIANIRPTSLILQPLLLTSLFSKEPISSTSLLSLLLQFLVGLYYHSCFLQSHHYFFINRWEDVLDFQHSPFQIMGHRVWCY